MGSAAGPSPLAAGQQPAIGRTASPAVGRKYVSFTTDELEPPVGEIRAISPNSRRSTPSRVVSAPFPFMGSEDTGLAEKFAQESMHSFSFVSPHSVQNSPFHANNGNVRSGAFLKRSVDLLREQRQRGSSGASSDSLHIITNNTPTPSTISQTPRMRASNPAMRVDTAAANATSPSLSSSLMTAPPQLVEQDPFNVPLDHASAPLPVPENAATRQSRIPDHSKLSVPGMGVFRSASDSYNRPQLNVSSSCVNLPGQVTVESKVDMLVHSPMLPTQVTNRWGRHTSQAVFTTTIEEPFRILSTNDYACLIFGLRGGDLRSSNFLHLFTKPSQGRMLHIMKRPHAAGQVQICGDVFCIRRRISSPFGAASVWMKENNGHIIWILEEISAPSAILEVHKDGSTVATGGTPEDIFGFVPNGSSKITDLVLGLPGVDDEEGHLDYKALRTNPWYSAREHTRKLVRPCVIEPYDGGDEYKDNEYKNDQDTEPGANSLLVSLLPYASGIFLVDGSDFTVLTSNHAFSRALFGFEVPRGYDMLALTPRLRSMLCFAQKMNFEIKGDSILTETLFRRAAYESLFEEKPEFEDAVFQPIAVTRNGAYIPVDLQVCAFAKNGQANCPAAPYDDFSSLIFGIWISFDSDIYGRTTPSSNEPLNELARRLSLSDGASGSGTATPEEGTSPPTRGKAKLTLERQDATTLEEDKLPTKINDLRIIEEMGSGAYGQVKLARIRKKPSVQVVVKYIIKTRILVDTWTRDRKLGTVPMEIHVLNFLKEHKHRNIVDMVTFFEDSDNYYLLMTPHGPGMDLFDYIEVHTTMDERECLAIFIQVARALQHLHSLGIVHRDIKDENIVLDRNGWVKLIDFGSANYVRKGPFDTFHGTLDYAAPEVLRGEMYAGKEQDVWAQGILLYTIVYKENPFYNVDEIMERDLRVPYVLSPDNIDLIRRMLERDVSLRPTMDQVLDHPWLKPYETTSSKELQIPLAL